MSASDYDWELREAIEELVDSGELDEDSEAYATSRQVMRGGRETLTPHQKNLYDTYILPLLDLLARRREGERVLDSTPH